MSFFSNIFDNSPAQQAVTKATDEILISFDWATALDLADTVNSDPAIGKEVLKGIKKRMAHKEAKVQGYAVTLLESLVKNCGAPFLAAVESKDFLPALLALATAPKTEQETRQQIAGVVSDGAATGGADFVLARSQLQGLGFQFPETAAPGGGAVSLLMPPSAAGGGGSGFEQS
eukprot:2291831-Prymnesium_polylepis.1